MAITARAGHVAGVIALADRGSQYTSNDYLDHCQRHQLRPSVGPVTTCFDQRRAESTIGLYKAECIHFDGPWRNVDEVELATLNWVWWFNEIRLHSAIGTSRQSNTRTPTTVHTTTPNSTCCRENPPSTKLARFIQSRRPQRKPHPASKG